MSRNIVVCCDGTANEFASDLTNVAKLCQALIKGREHQLTHYHPGIGTMAPIGYGTPVGSKVARVAGLAFGYGLQQDVARAYSFVMNNWREGDSLFLFGFSRGAYTARVVAALLHMFGLVSPGNDGLVPYLVRMLWNAHDLPRGAEAEGERSGFFAAARRFKETMSVADCRPHFLGVWDTVSSVGWIGSPVALPFTKDNPDPAIVRHAVSIDERRAFFRTNLFSSSHPDIRQVWFPGVHCDVGGGYPEAGSGLSKYALAWMIGEASAAGLLMNEEQGAVVLGQRGSGFAIASPDAPLHDSMTARWRLAEFVPKRYWDRFSEKETWRLNLFRRRSMGTAPIVHDVAWELPNDYALRLPSDAIRLSMIRSN